MNLQLSESSAEKEDANTYKVSNLFCKGLWGDDWLNMVLNVVDYDGLAELPEQRDDIDQLWRSTSFTRATSSVSRWRMRSWVIASDELSTESSGAREGQTI